ncbi:hypothetical protein [Kitasatospora sp. MBT66]|uniref:hypothetical protein n=1 Tax=Kitasatospora sp. MBT66 TaxID=1444769 RepID=UPI0005BA1E01|nr:hypothetical protein [Kitasatospora sp. MBT66]
MTTHPCPEDTFQLPVDPDDTAGVDAWLKPYGWCVEPDPAQARPGHFRLRPRRTGDPDDHDGGRTFAPGTSVQWNGSDIVRVDPAAPESLRPLLQVIGNPEHPGHDHG